jgi:hypothetical protein
MTAMTSRCARDPLNGTSQYAVLRTVLGAATEIIAAISSQNAIDGKTRTAILRSYKDRLGRAEADFVARATRAAQLAYLGGTVRGVFIWSAITVGVGVFKDLQPEAGQERVQEPWPTPNCAGRQRDEGQERADSGGELWYAVFFGACPHE